MDLDELVEKWVNSGLIEGLPEDIKIHAALSYEKVAQILIGDEEELGDFLTTAIFPVIYRVCKTGLKIKNLPDLIEKFKQFIIDNEGVLHDVYGVSSADIEAEMCKIFSEDYIEWVKDNPELDPIKYVPKHKL
jgi:hypothetical protein